MFKSALMNHVRSLEDIQCFKVLIFGQFFILGYEARIWDWQDECMHGTPLAETPKACTEAWQPRRVTSVCAPTSSSS